MTNDTTTLQGSLVEMKDQLIYELGQKGVTASYDSSTGLLGLIGRISEIQQGGSCYHIEFSEDSYTPVGGSVVLECTLQQNYVPLANATVTLSDGSSVYSSITNQNGIATFNLNGLNASATYTCSYSNVSDNCFVKVVEYLLYDDASTDQSSTLFGSNINLRNGGTTITGWNDGYYTITQTSSQRESMRVLNDLTGIASDFCLEYDSYVEQVQGSSGFVIYNSNTAWEKLTDDSNSSKDYWYGYNNGSFHENKFYGYDTTYKKWVHYKYTIQGTTFTMEVTYNGNIVVTHTETIHFTRDNTTQYGLDSEWNRNTTTRYKNIVAYEI